MREIIATEFIQLLNTPMDMDKLYDKKMRSLAKRCSQLRESKKLDAECKSQIEEACKKIGDYRIPMKRRWGNKHFFLHSVYAQASRVYWALFHEIPALNKKQQHILSEFQKNKFYVMTTEADIINDCLKPIFNRLEVVSKNLPKNYEPKNVTRKNYSSGGSKLPNQVPLENLTESELKNVASVFENTQLGDVIINHYRSNFGAGNIRTWRYLPRHTEAVDGVTPNKQKVGAHYDGLPPHSFKLMMFDGDITPQHGCFEVVDKASDSVKARLQVIGRNPCIMVVSNALIHRALPPASGFHRDTIEITIEPYLGDRPIYVDAGCVAGNPLNPFSDWTVRI